MKKTHFILFIILAQILTLTSNIPLILHLVRNQEDRIYPLVHTDWSHDYYSYLALITEGKSGSWLHQEVYTVEPTKPGFFHIYYIFVGKIAAIFNLWPPIAYHLTRIIAVELFITALYLLSDAILGRNLAFWGALFALISTISPLNFFSEKVDLTAYPIGIRWFINFDALDRLNGIPHHLMGQALLLFSLYLAINFFKSRKIKHAFLSAILIFIGSIIFPPVLTPVSLGLPISYIFFTLAKFIKEKRLYLDKKIIAGITIILFSSVASYLSIKLQQQQGFPWNVAESWEVERWNYNEPNFDYNFLFLFGLTFLVAIPTIIKNLSNDKLEKIFISLWSLLPFILLPAVNIINIPKIRILHSAPFVPLGFLAAQSIFTLFPFNRRKVLQIATLALFILINLSVSLSLLNLRINSLDYYLSGKQIHLPKTYYQALTYISENVPKDSVLMSDQTMGTIIPSFAPITSFVGHFLNTMNFAEKRQQLASFYGQKWDKNTAKEFLSKNRIAFVYLGPEEKSYGGNILNYDFLTLVYQNTEVQIFQVKI